MLSTPSYQTRAIAVTDASAVGHVRRVATSLADKVGLDATGVGELALIVTEASTNLLQHAGGGELLVRAIAGAAAAVEILALDKGPGMSNIDRCLEDGYSTGGSRGVGLGSIARLADRFDIYSQVGAGTALYALRYARPLAASTPARGADVGVVCVPYVGETIAGDAWAVHARGDRTIVLVVDGLGHGPFAAEAALAAVRVFEAEAGEPPATLLARVHVALSSTRGAAGAVFDIDWAARRVLVAGVGNITGTLLSREKSRGLSSHNGILGQGKPRIQEFVYPLPEEAMIVIHSDGIATRWDLDPYPGIQVRETALVAGVLYRDFSRRRDDATVLVVRERPRRAQGAH